MCPVVPEVAGSLNWCGSQSSSRGMSCSCTKFVHHVMVGASPVTAHIMEDKLVLFYVQKISLLLLLVAMDVVSGRTNQVHTGKILCLQL